MKKNKFNKIGKIVTVIVLIIASFLGVKNKDIKYFLNSNKDTRSVTEKNDSKDKLDTENTLTKEDTEPIRAINGEVLSDIQYDPDKYPENVIELEEDKGLTKEQEKLLNELGEDKVWQYYETSKGGLTTRATALMTFEAMQNHSSAKQERPNFKSDLYIPGELVGGYYDKLNKRWTSDNKDSNGKMEKYNRKLQLDGYNGYLYNKSHLIAWSLGGDMEAHNLILGTRWQNVGGNKNTVISGGMANAEVEVRNALYDNPELKVFYQAIPIYKNSEIMPRGVYVKAYSISDNGKTIDKAIYTFNNQEGITIDYNIGSFTVDENK